MSNENPNAALERLKRDAEREMRRNLDSDRPQKRMKQQDGNTSFIAVDRYHYSIVEELEKGAKGFIITCNFRREKSATREAVQLLRRYMPHHLFPEPQQQGVQQQMEEGEQHGAQQQQQLAAAIEAHPTAAGDGDSGDEEDSEEEEDAHPGCNGGSAAATAGGASAAKPEGASPSAFGLAKVGCRGVVLVRLSAAAAACVDPVRLLAALLADLEAGALQRPKHCHRIIPLDSTCALTEEGLSRAVAAAAASHRARLQADSPGDATAAAAAIAPFTYTVVYHSRLTEPTAAEGGGGAAATCAAPSALVTPPALADGAAAASNQSTEAEAAGAEAEAAVAASSSGGGVGPAVPGAVERGLPAAPAGAAAGEVLRDRGRIIAVAAGSMARAFGEAAKVQLKKPQVALLVEAVPVAGRLLAGVGLVGQQLFVAKGKLVVKPLIKGAATARE